MFFKRTFPLQGDAGFLCRLHLQVQMGLLPSSLGFESQVGVFLLSLIRLLRS